MTEEFKAEYTPGEELLRIDRFLGSRLEQVSRSYLQKLVKEGAVLVNGKPVKAAIRLKMETGFVWRYRML